MGCFTIRHTDKVERELRLSDEGLKRRPRHIGKSIMMLADHKLKRNIWVSGVIFLGEEAGYRCLAGDGGMVVAPDNFDMFV